MLADAASNTLWTCQLTPVPNTTPVQRHTALRGFDLSTGAPKIRWNLPGDNSMCNDFAIGPDKALYITDTANGKIFKLPAGASAAVLYLEHWTLMGVDGITFLSGTLYVNNVIFNKLYRIPVNAAGKPGTPVDIWTDQLVKGPDGMRAANGKRPRSPIFPPTAMLRMRIGQGRTMTYDISSIFWEPSTLDTGSTSVPGYLSTPASQSISRPVTTRTGMAYRWIGPPEHLATASMDLRILASI